RRQAVVVPATTIERVVETLLSRGGRIPRGYLGVALQRVSGGAIVLGVEGASPADAAGLIVGDVITAIGGERIEDADDVHAQLGSGTVGAHLRIDVLRGGGPRQLDVVVGERAE
ncbi:MAG TPA: PDZ domain-containing protein, partial [Candidatus Elarobacter sp.]|nr:PDZ domain-containing protein [Candidatus Elarobacter sp.]